MKTIVIFEPDGSIHSVRRGEDSPDEVELAFYIPDGGFYIDISGQELFDEMDIVDIHNGYEADSKRKMLVKKAKNDK
jgi:hypothetical protein